MKLKHDAPQFAALKKAALDLVTANDLEGAMMDGPIETTAPSQLYTAAGTKPRAKWDCVALVVVVDPEDTEWFTKALHSMVQRYEQARINAAAMREEAREIIRKDNADAN